MITGEALAAAQPRLDADALGRHAGRARDGQGALPGPGGRGGDRRESPYVAKDALELIDVDYEPLPAVATPQQALEDDAPLIRDDKEGQTANSVYHWEAGDKDATDRAFAEADRVVSLDTFYPRCHPAPLECCGCVADVNPATGKATIYMTSQAPHAHRTLFAIVAGLPEHQIRIVSPDIGGGFGNKVPIYPGYVVATAASLLIGRPVKWVEDRTGNLISTGFARDYHMHGELALKGDRIVGLHTTLLSDQGAFFADAQPTKFQSGALPHRHRLVRHPGRARRRRRRVHEQGAGRRRLPLLVPGHGGLVPDRAARRRRRARARRRPGRVPPEELHQAGAVPVHVGHRVRLRLGRLRRGDGARAREARLRASCGASRQRRASRGACIGIGLASFTEVLGAGPGKEYDIAGLRMFDSAELRVHPTGKAILKLGVRTQGQGHETTFAQIVAEELGIPYEDVEVQEGDTDNTPYGLGTYASRSTPVAGAATAVISRKLRDKARATRGAPARGVRGRPRVGAGSLRRQGRRPSGRRRSRTSRSPPTRTFPTAWRQGSRASTTTTRRT